MRYNMSKYIYGKFKTKGRSLIDFHIRENHNLILNIFLNIYISIRGNIKIKYLNLKIICIICQTIV